MEKDGLKLIDNTGKFPEFVSLHNKWAATTELLSTGMFNVPAWKDYIDYARQHRKDFIRFALDCLNSNCGGWPIMSAISELIDPSSEIAQADFMDPMSTDVVMIFKTLLTLELNDWKLTLADGSQIPISDYIQQEDEKYNRFREETVLYFQNGMVRLSHDFMPAKAMLKLIGETKAKIADFMVVDTLPLKTETGEVREWFSPGNAEFETQTIDMSGISTGTNVVISNNHDGDCLLKWLDYKKIESEYLKFELNS